MTECKPLSKTITSFPPAFEFISNCCLKLRASPGTYLAPKPPFLLWETVLQDCSGGERGTLPVGAPRHPLLLRALPALHSLVVCYPAFRSPTRASTHSAAINSIRPARSPAFGTRPDATARCQGGPSTSTRLFILTLAPLHHTDRHRPSEGPHNHTQQQQGLAGPQPPPRQQQQPGERWQQNLVTSAGGANNVRGGGGASSNNRPSLAAAAAARGHLQYLNLRSARCGRVMLILNSLGACLPGLLCPDLPYQPCSAGPVRHGPARPGSLSAHTCQSARCIWRGQHGSPDCPPSPESYP